MGNGRTGKGREWKGGKQEGRGDGLRRRRKSALEFRLTRLRPLTTAEPGNQTMKEDSVINVKDSRQD